VQDAAPACLREASRLLRLLQEYVAVCAAPSLPALVEAACAPAVRGLERALMGRGPLHSWPHAAVALQRSLLALLSTLLQRVQVLPASVSFCSLIQLPLCACLMMSMHRSADASCQMCGIQTALMMKSCWGRLSTTVTGFISCSECKYACQVAEVGHRLVILLCGDRRAANFRAETVRSAAQLVEHGTASMQGLLVAFLDIYAGLAHLLGRQPAAGKVISGQPAICFRCVSDVHFCAKARC
jgi:hypothetical protein